MKNPWEQLSPKAGFTVHLSTPLSDIDQQVLTYLYQPIIGVEAFGLYFSLMREAQLSAGAMHLHTELIDLMNISLPSLYQARVRLEGIALLKTFVKKVDGTAVFYYDLKSPESAYDFFNDDLLSTLLLETVSEKKYKQLVKHFTPAKIDKTEYTEITQNFLDVYRFNPETLEKNQKLLSENGKKIPKKNVEKVKLEVTSFDWDLFYDLLNPLLVDKKQIVDLKEFILTLHQLYGLDELTMKQIITDASDQLTNQVNKYQVRKQIQERYHKTHSHKLQVSDYTQVEKIPMAKNSTATSTEQQQKKRANQLIQAGFHKKDIQLILSSEQFPPMIFIEAIKNEKGGFVSNNERNTVENLQKYSRLPNSVINILIHYILSSKGHSSLSASYTNSIANDWAQSGVATPEAALKKVREITVNNQPKTINKSYNNRKKNKIIRKESLPEWVDSPSTEGESSAESKAFFAEQLRSLRADRREGDS